MKVRAGEGHIWNPTGPVSATGAPSSKPVNRQSYAPVPGTIDELPTAEDRHAEIIAAHRRFIGSAIREGRVPSYRGMLGTDPLGVISVMDGLLQEGAQAALQQAVGPSVKIKPATPEVFGGELAVEGAQYFTADTPHGQIRFALASNGFYGPLK